MCGIAGIIDSRGQSVDEGILRRMIDVVDHRGPDGSGVWADGGAGFAHARLSIIDLAGGAQPMASVDDSRVITYNGEVFNYVELRQQLVAKGERFNTRSDTEVILSQYAVKGDRCVEDFNGQWAFAIWDKRRRRLFASRDRMGIRPFYYAMVDGALVFGSEIKSILMHPRVRREIDVQALDQIFTFWHTIGTRTIFKDIYELPPGYCLSYAEGKLETWPYWQLQYDGVDGQMSDDDYVGQLRELLIDATRLRLRSDVPVGAYLSGGLDSSVITAMVKRFTDTPLKTFSVAFEDGEFDESAYQQDVIRHLETDHHETRCSYADIGESLPDVVWHAEKPILRTAPAPLFRLSGLVREHGYKVVLTGEGSDEILGGYDIFKEAKIRRFWSRQPESRLRPLLLKKLYPYMKNIQSQSPAYLQAFFHVGPQDLASPFFSHLPRWELTGRLKVLFSDEVKAALGDYDALTEASAMLPQGFGRWHPFCQAQYLETTGLMPGYLLSSQGDRMLMGHSVEGRFPFLDHRVVAFAATMPPRLKMRGLDEKHVLKRAAADLVPASVLRRPKQPYRAPDAASLFGTVDRPIQHEYVQELLDPRRIEQDGLFQAAAVEKLVRKAASGRAIGVKDNMALVGIVTAQLLVDQFVHRFGRRC